MYSSSVDSLWEMSLLLDFSFQAEDRRKQTCFWRFVKGKQQTTTMLEWNKCKKHNFHSTEWNMLLHSIILEAQCGLLSVHSSYLIPVEYDCWEKKTKHYVNMMVRIGQYESLLEVIPSEYTISLWILPVWNGDTALQALKRLACSIESNRYQTLHYCINVHCNHSLWRWWGKFIIRKLFTFL